MRTGTIKVIIVGDIAGLSPDMRGLRAYV